MNRRKLLWVDCVAGAVVGVGMLALAGWLSDWYRLPYNLLIVMGLANLAYASYSFSLARRSKRPRALIVLLAFANMTWGLVCLGLAVYFFQTAGFFGLCHLVLEAIFVGGLGYVEWRWRELLLTE